MFYGRLKDMISTSPNMKEILNPYPNSSGLYAMVDISAIQERRSKTSEILVKHEINCIFIDWFPSKEGIDSEKYID